LTPVPHVVECWPQVRPSDVAVPSAENNIDICKVKHTTMQLAGMEGT
jgi:hypothetical protein